LYCGVLTAESQYPIIVDEQGVYTAQPAYTSQVVVVTAYCLEDKREDYQNC